MADAACAALMTLEPGRKLVALAGPPAAGKSTVSHLLCDRLRAMDRSAAILPMDGFHLDNRILTARGLLDRKGAPDTFDIAGFTQAVATAAKGAALVYPVFDRPRDLAIAGAGYLSPDTEFVLVEGNYLLFDADLWRDLNRLWDFRIWIDAAPDDLARRLTQRWLYAGLPPDVAEAKVAQNDLPNARLVMSNRIDADLHLRADRA